jgi:cellulose synthase/poly-beta-1,6-N-acetylglucosamine synthase-like glycosyltransferase
MMEVPGLFTAALCMVTAIYGWMIITLTIGLLRLIRKPRLQQAVMPWTVTVIIPVRNEEANIRNILAEVAGQDFPSEQLEVIVADDLSGDRTMALAEEFALRHPDLPLRLVYAPEGVTDYPPGKKAAISRAVATAGGDILLFTDADTFREKGWISAMTGPFADTGIEMVLGPVFYTGEKNLLQRLQSLEFLGLMGVTAGSAAIGHPVMCNGANLAYRREAFFSTGGFLENTGYPSGDDQFMLGAVKKMYGSAAIRFTCDPRALVGTLPEATVAGFLNQRMRWASKSPGYRDPAVIAVGMVTFLVHLLLLAGLALGLTPALSIRIPLLVWVLKMAVDFPVVWLTGGFFGHRKNLGYYVLAQLFQLLYLPVAGVAGIFFSYSWKGRWS